MSLVVVGHIVVVVMNLSHELEESLRLNLTTLKEVVLVHQEGRDDVQLIMITRLHEFKNVEFKCVNLLQ